MWVPFLTAITDVLPGSEIVHDKYHVVSYLNKAVDEVRRSENKALQHDGIDSLKGTRFTWLRNSTNWTDRDRKTFKSLQADGLNSKIQSIKSAARGFRNFENYRTAILFYCGRLALHP